MKITVKLSDQDWKDLVNFVRGDLANMEESEIKCQMRRVCHEITASIGRQSFRIKTIGDYPLMTGKQNF